MSKFSFFNPFSWFKGEERKELEKLKQEIGELKKKPEKPYRNIIISGSNVTIVFYSGDVIMKGDVAQDIIAQVLVSKDEDEIKALLYNTEYKKTIAEVNAEVIGTNDDIDSTGNFHIETEEEAATVKKHSHALEGHPDFEIKDGEVYLKGVELAMPAIVAGSFIELVERMNIALKKDKTEEYVDLDDKFDSLKLFWCWLALNPIEAARRDAIVFIRKNKITIDVNGLLIMYRRVVTKSTNTDREWNEFVSASYTKVKKAKKGPKNFWVHLVDDEFKLSKTKDEHDGDTLVGNLAELYAGLSSSEGNLYTDGYTRTKEIRIGHIYREDEDKINLNNKIDCANGLHVGAHSFGFNGFGDTGVVVLVNPMYIRSVPVSSTNKMRVSEMFIVGAYELNDYKEDVENQELIDFSVNYCSSKLEDLKADLKDKNLGKLVCQRQQTTLSVEEVVDVTKVLEDRIKNLS